MVTRDTAWSPGTPCWVDLGVPDIATAQAFYSRLLGWDCQSGTAEAGGYSMCLLGGRAAAGIGPQMGQQAPPSWMTYLATTDADQTAAAIKAAGGLVVAEPFEVLNLGRMAIAIDPGGATFGIWQARGHYGVAVANEPGALTWNENMSRDMDRNQSFYQAVFGYSFGDMSAGGVRYGTLRVDGTEVGGIGQYGADIPADFPAGWNVYFTVPDADATVDQLHDLGGSVLRPAWDSPYGRMAMVADNQGAAFAIIGARA
jgi:predicted enzyme related to lactoylglutathione lyase